MNPSGLPGPRSSRISAPSGTSSVPTSLRIHLDTWTLVRKTEEGRSYASVEDCLQLQSKAENRERQGLPKKPFSRAASHAAWLLTPFAPAPQTGEEASLAAHHRGRAERRYGSTDPLLQPQGQGQGPNLSLKRSLVGAGERTEQVLGVSL